MSKNAIEARGLEKRYGEVEAVRGVSFAVRQGEVFGFLGPNGARINMCIADCSNSR